MLKMRLSFLLFAFCTCVSAATLANEPAADPATAPALQLAQAAVVNLNTADAATLQRELSGIGESKAQAIVDYREAHGSFASVDELLEVKGIGEATLQKNRSKLTVD
ncbi:helix-hairpin-helix domain-containing protein [Pseudomonas sp. NCCP-436]|uniref:ComEA family DNA-binding protein n=1 Tax=Pseudomonas sp. NCCP-436 TaxID=2842481 RepID=UPI001C7FD9F1|nr:helix-hairpin-helix domain-containing protein [Pseudomonas sp. NCCP-436]GIZ13958.1 hypothetical protein NCCP436_33740 [Pseudomonas sp. NCCP-436]